MHILIECSQHKIYQRIIESIAVTLSAKGHMASLVEPGTFGSKEDYLQELRSSNPDAILISNPTGLITGYDVESDLHLFEETDCKLIFLHHDNLFSNLCDTASIRRLITAYQKEKHRSHHFCIERHNCTDLIELGISQAFPIQHATEFGSSDGRPFDDDKNSYLHDVSFVGHILPSLGNAMESIPFSHRIAADFWKRVTDMSHTIEPSAENLAEMVTCINASTIDKMTMKYFYHSSLHLLSQHYRGEVLSRSGNSNIHIFGGDPAYLHGVERDCKIAKKSISYHKATSLPSEAAHIYRSSKISLNITPLQFDRAVINRVVDIAAAGGFPLTDWKADLDTITSVSSEISYRSPEELEAKIEYYAHPDHAAEREEIAAALREEVYKKCNYSDVIDSILSRLETTSTTAGLLPFKVDLGCGRHKPSGYIGVDTYKAPGVDIVADLNTRFPFASNTVDELRAHDIVEHLPRQLHTMNEIWRICKPNAVVDIRVPSTDGRGAFQDPTHVSFWNINSFNYYCIEFPAYLELCRTYGFMGMFTLVAIEEESSPDGVIHVRARLKAVKLLTVKAATPPELRIQVLANIDEMPFGQEEYQRLKELTEAAIKLPASKRLTFLIKVHGMTQPDIESVLTSLMMELILEGCVEDPENAPTLLVASDEAASETQQHLTINHIIDLQTFDMLTLNDLLMSTA